MKSSHQIVREVIIASLLAFFVLIPSGVLMLAQAPSPGFPDLVGALESTPGCLGVEVASTPGGKRVIFAWFENKQAVLNWYYSDAHQNTMRMFFPGLPPRKPLNDIADESGPIMAIASLTVADTPQGGATSLPVSQIAIELYAPLPGGLALGGRFAPATVKVAGMMQAKMRRVQTEAVPQRDTRTVTIKVSGARNAKGQLGVALFQDAAGFPEDASKAVRVQQIDIDPETMSAHVVFHDVSLESYAISVRHDENMNGRLDKNLLGMPTEGYGTSNNPKAKLRAPRFDEARVPSDAGGQTVEISLIY
jgi:uncharacterized protein (DUF2141 family)